jgi:hypothetical protein
MLASFAYLRSALVLVESLRSRNGKFRRAFLFSGVVLVSFVTAAARHPLAPVVPFLPHIQIYAHTSRREIDHRYDLLNRAGKCTASSSLDKFCEAQPAFGSARNVTWLIILHCFTLFHSTPLHLSQRCGFMIFLPLVHSPRSYGGEGLYHPGRSPKGYSATIPLLVLTAAAVPQVARLLCKRASDATPLRAPQGNLRIGGFRPLQRRRAARSR